VAAPSGFAAVAEGFRAPLRRRDFRLLTAGQSLSSFGDLMFTVALPFLLLSGGTLAGARDLAGVLTVLGIARLIGTPIGGVLADRWDPRRVMLVADGGRAIGVLLFVPWDGAARPQVWQLLAGALAVGVLEGIFLPAYRAITPMLVSDRELPAANSVGEAANVIAVIAGPLVAGIAVGTVGPAAVIGINAVTFALSAAILVAMRRPVRAGEGAATADRPVPGEAAPGPSLSRFVRRTPLFPAVLLMTAVLSLTAAAILSVALPVLAADRFSDGARAYGYLLGAHGVGLLAGTVAAGAVRWPERRGLVAVALLVLHGSGLVVLPQVPGLLPAVLILALLGVVDGALGVLVLTLLQRLAPDTLRGRVMAAFTVVRTSTYPLAVALAGIVVTRADAPAMFLVAGAGVLVVAGLGVLLRPVREA
jgi:MFS transporter, DHA3 family, tetracycline resistance protein